MPKKIISPEQCAAIYQAAFSGAAFTKNHWDEKTFASLLNKKTNFLCGDRRGFILWQVLLDEAEILTFAVLPEKQRQGLGRELLLACLAELEIHNIKKLYLEVAATNQAAINLYETVGFIKIGVRKDYYRGDIDALNYIYNF